MFALQVSLNAPVLCTEMFAWQVSLDTPVLFTEMLASCSCLAITGVEVVNIIWIS